MIRTSAEGAPRKRRPFVLALVIGAAAVAGIAIGAGTATRAPSPEPTIGIAALPTSTPDLRPPLPTRTVTPTQRPTTPPSASPLTIGATNPPNVAPSPIHTFPSTATPVPRGRAVVYFASRQGVPVEVDAPDALKGQSQSDHVFFRLLALRSAKAGGPPGYDNLFAKLRAQLAETTVERAGTVVVGFSVPGGDWGVPGDDVRLVLQQIVFTATEEPGIDLVLITQNGGKPAVIAGQTIDKELGRAELR